MYLLKFAFATYFRYDMSYPENHYIGESMARSLTKMKKWVIDQKYSCVHQPLLNVPLQNVVLDELHLMLRITGNAITALYMNFNK